MVALLCSACDGCSSQSAGSATPLPKGARLVPVPVSDLAGLSGLARDDRGSLWTVPENVPLRLELSAAGAELGRVRVSGVPEGVELESVAWLGADRFAIGTEGGCKDGSERVLLVTREGASAKTTRVVTVCSTLRPV